MMSCSSPETEQTQRQCPSQWRVGATFTPNLAAPKLAPNCLLGATRDQLEFGLLSSKRLRRLREAILGQRDYWWFILNKFRAHKLSLAQTDINQLIVQTNLPVFQFLPEG